MWQAPRVSWGLVYLVLALGAEGVVGQVRMLEEQVFVFASDGERAELTCRASEVADNCMFSRPDGRKVCSNEALDYYYDSDEFDCVEDENLEVMPASDACRLIIHDVDSGSHFGAWTCSVISWGDKASATVTLTEQQPIEVEMVNLWGEVSLEIGTEPRITCGVYSASEVDSDRENFVPGMMVWTLGDEIVHRSDVYERDYDTFIQVFPYEPRIEDDGKKLECNIQGKTDTIRLAIYRLAEEADGKSGAEETVTLRQKATIFREFEVYPRPDDEDVYWELGDTVVKAGESVKRFTSSEFRKTGENRYKIGLQINPVAKVDGETDCKLVVNTKTGSTGDRAAVELPFSFNVESPTAPEPTKAPVKAEDEAQEEQKEAAPTEEVASVYPPVEASKSSVSLYIIIAIIVLVVALGLLFYCSKCRKKKQAKEAERDPELAQPLHADAKASKLEPSDAKETEGLIMGVGDENKYEAATLKLKPESPVVMKRTEERLMARLEPSETQTSVKPSNKDSKSEHESIKQMTSNLLDKNGTNQGDLKPEPLAKEHPSFNSEHDEVKKLVSQLEPNSVVKEEEQPQPRN